MPALPSGQHVALDPTPLEELLRDAASPFNAHKIMALQHADDLMMLYDMLVLKPADTLTADERAAARPVAGTPPELVGVPVGRLVEFGTIAREWSVEDKVAFEAFYFERVEPAMQAQMARVRETQEALRRSPTLAGAFAAMWAEGAHPLQGGADDDD